MTKFILTIAAALFVAQAFLASDAQACISCSYVPEVVNTPVRGAKTFEKKRVIVANTERAPRQAKKRVAVDAPVTTSTAAAATPAPTDVQPATDVRPTIEAQSQPVSEGASAEGAMGETKGSETKVASSDLGCKKFIPTAGMTVSVPCE